LEEHKRIVEEVTSYKTQVLNL